VLVLVLHVVLVALHVVLLVLLVALHVVLLVLVLVLVLKLTLHVALLDANPRHLLVCLDANPRHLLVLVHVVDANPRHLLVLAMGVLVCVWSGQKSTMLVQHMYFLLRASWQLLQRLVVVVLLQVPSHVDLAIVVLLLFLEQVELSNNYYFPLLLQVDRQFQTLRSAGAYPKTMVCYPAAQLEVGQ
jgi:hypothetical protein